ncbi:spindle and kinetochore-associated protein 1-like [Pseudomyrmex gracilis]|uniref:spindle and kinetochore-associated protein 1-like n=1 Tax=Pseudomyrmex gracilis TaxID=219809 RepID=UPI000995A4A5|nr:spindle and kinetochore-associated protein 1-like [Pseudomyrmex gracilis]XP_020285808.1 spindle and kinetochore-associated protein 1-like [Pseudomyrmex gracilis]XP_020285809.1 spindle and kinetochore-associated protein 1-like [Pseudomyrmex gracilis]XP_020285810.1 spindle and kinetochore-associated protein 1-like [Pseudomyrmex gracilis]
MSKEENEVILEKILDGQLQKMTSLKKTTLLLQCKHEIKDDLQELHTVVCQVSKDVEDMRNILTRIKEQNAHLKKLSSLLETLDRKIVHRTQNIPINLIQDYQSVKKKEKSFNLLSPNILEYSLNSIELSTQSKTSGSVRLKNSEIENCKRVLSYEPDICLTIPLITAEEFSKIPKYMIGRQTLETINGLINGINQTLIAKYTILLSGKVAAQKKGEINLYLQYKKQEYEMKGENGYLYFFTAEDYYRKTKTKLDKTKLNLITALRHCKRLRDCRIKNESRYVITSQ